MDINKFIKPGKDAVVEIEEVEYLLDDNAATSIARGDKKIALIQLFDRRSYLFDIEIVVKAIEAGGIVDYLDKRS